VFKNYFKGESLNIIFFGSGKFAIPALKYLLNRENIFLKAVITQPDRKAKRGMHLKPTEVGEFIAQTNFKGEVLKPEDINSKESILKIESFSPDIFVVASYGSIISKDVLSLASIMPLNIHGSLLPQYRGAAPVNWAIINGEKETGVTIFKMNEKLDAGDIIVKQGVTITKSMDAESLESILADESIDILGKVLESLNRGDVKLYPQEEGSSYAPKIKREDGLIDWSVSAVDIDNRVRGLSPWPRVFSYIDFKILKIYKVEVDLGDYSDVSVSEITRVENEYFNVKCGVGSLKILELQLEGKRKMTAKEFLLGRKIEWGMKLGA